LVLTGGGSFCPGCGDSLALNYSVSDGGSGVAGWQLTSGSLTLASGSGPATAGLGWDGGPSTGSGSGSGSLSLEGRDLAGNTSQETLGFTIIVPTPIPPTAVVAPPVGGQSGQAPVVVAVLPSGGQSPAATVPPLVQPGQAPGPVLSGDEGPSRPAVTVQFGDRLPLETFISSGVGGGGPPSGLDPIDLFWPSAAAGGIAASMLYLLEQGRRQSASPPVDSGIRQGLSVSELQRQLETQLAQARADLASKTGIRVALENADPVEKRDPTWKKELDKAKLDETACRNRITSLTGQLDAEKTRLARMSNVQLHPASSADEIELMDPGRDLNENMRRIAELNAERLRQQAEAMERQRMLNTVPAWIAAHIWNRMPEDLRLDAYTHHAWMTGISPAEGGDIWRASGAQGDYAVFAQGGRLLYVLDSVNLRTTPAYPESVVIGSLAPGSQVTWTGRTCNADGILWYQVVDGRGRTGWASARYTDTLDLPRQVIPTLPTTPSGYTLRTGVRADGVQFVYYTGASGVVTIGDQHNPIRFGYPDPDVEQYIYVADNVTRGLKHNLCGAFCAAYLSGNSIGDFLDLWKVREPAGYKIGVTDDEPYNMDVVKGMLRMYGMTYQDLDNSARLLPSQMQAEIASGKVLIAGVGMSDATGGILATGDTGHWVVVRDVSMNRDGVWVHIYNPFMNRFEIYDFETFRCAFSNLRGTGHYNGTWTSR
ncbi:MAG: SH3 domain-containing protein, partial [Chloroflexota bacterium]